MSINDKPTADVENQSNDTVDEIQAPDELAMLKSRAKVMGLTFSPNIGLDALRKKVNDAMEGVKKDETPAPAVGRNPLAEEADDDENLTPAQRYHKMRLEQTRMVRVRIQNLDPKKKDLPGEVITIANEVMGTIRKYVPFGEATDDGYHIPFAIYNFLLGRQFLNIRTTKKNGQIVVDSKMVREFSIEVLPPLTEEELHNLGQAQLAAGNE